MYSPPIPRTAEAILAKLSLPRNCLGFMIMYSPFSSKVSRDSRSSGKDMRMSSSERVLFVSTGAGGAVVGRGAEGVGVGEVGLVICPTASDLTEAETTRSSSETLFSFWLISSTFAKSWSSLSWSLLTCRFPL